VGKRAPLLGEVEGNAWVVDTHASHILKLVVVEELGQLIPLATCHLCVRSCHAHATRCSLRVGLRAAVEFNVGSVGQRGVVRKVVGSSTRLLRYSAHQVGTRS
jgi:hypothetical protein